MREKTQQEINSMEDLLARQFKAKDENGNVWKLAMRQQTKYPTRYDLIFYFNEKPFKLQHFATLRDATNVWELIEAVSNKRQEG